MLASAAISATVAWAANTPGEQRVSIKGRILTTKGEPLAGGTVYFFNSKSGPPPHHEEYWRVPDFKSNLDEGGCFAMELPEGGYFMGAIKRLAGDRIGPPRDGDYYFVSLDGKGLPILYEVKGSEQLDVGTISGGGVFRSGTVAYGNGITSIAGRVLDREGNPVGGAMVLAFTSARRGGRPLFISDPTSDDGVYIIRVHDGGAYYLKVRSIYGGGPPGRGELVGIYGERQPEAVTVDKGKQLSGINIRVSGFPGKGPLQNANPLPVK